MIRLTALSLALLALVPLAPPGCPSQTSPVETQPTERGTLATTAEAPASTTVGETVMLHASANAAEGVVSYSWLQTAGPGVQIGAADQPAAQFVAPSLSKESTLRFMVTTSDDTGAVGRAEVQIAVAADPNYNPYGAGGPGGTITLGPVAAAGADQKVPGGDTVTLNGSSSNGDSLTYRWQQLSGPTVQVASAGTAVATLTAPQYDPAGTNVLEFQLAVTDASHQTVTDRVKVTIQNPNAGTNPKPRVKVSTTMGDFVIELDPEKAPITVGNFLKYVDDGFYTNTLVHRVVPGFVIQGGGYLAGMVEKPAGSAIINESNNGLKNVRGSVAMARMDDPNSAKSQFYVNLADNAFLDYRSGQPGYAVFGQVVDGMTAVDGIAAVATTTSGDFSDVPVQDITIRSVTRVE